MSKSKVTSNFNKKKILIVDDVAENLQILGNILDENNAEICFATNGKQALKLVDYNPPDLILLDISMPEMDGYEVCEILKKNDSTKEIPIIFLTAMNDSINIIKGFQVGGQDYITKPFNHDELLIRVKTHLDLKEKKDILEKQADILREWNDEQKRLNNFLEEQKNIIVQKNKYLTDSINYAKIIQNAMLSSEKKFKNIFPQSFILYKPKDIVSGDYYLMEKVKTEGGEEKIIIIAADCTGHGVPGALLTMLGISLLKQIIVYEEITHPSEILNRLNYEIADMLTNKEHTQTAADGMDIAVCCIFPKKQIMTFSGGKRPVYVLREKRIIEIKGGMHSIGGLYNDYKKNFINKKLQLKENDRVYLFSDGYADQFGGEKNKKFSRNRFKKLLINSNTMSMEEQKAMLAEGIKNWQGKQEQVDDILVLGFEFPPLQY